MSKLDKSEFSPLLPPGLHRITLAALREMCVGRFPISTARATIMFGLEWIVKALVAASIPGDLWIDRSFLTEKIDPADVDFSLRVDSLFVSKCSDKQMAFLEWLASSTDPKLIHSCHSFVWVEFPEGHSRRAESDLLRAYWLKQWGHSRANLEKGIAVVQLPEDAV